MHGDPEADSDGVGGIAITFTLTVPGGLVHPFTTRVTEYVPDARVEAPVMVGFCNDDENPFGPFQLYDDAPEGVAVSVIDWPAQTVDVPPAVGAAGIEFTTTVVVPMPPAQPAKVTDTEYTPADDNEAAGIEGDASEELNPLGPVHE